MEGLKADQEAISVALAENLAKEGNAALREDCSNSGQQERAPKP